MFLYLYGDTFPPLENQSLNGLDGSIRKKEMLAYTIITVPCCVLGTSSYDNAPANSFCVYVERSAVYSVSLTRQFHYLLRDSPD